MIDLPLELWYQITQYLPASEVVELYSVNTHLYNIAMDICWARVHLQDCLGIKVVDLLERLKSSSLSGRVQDITIQADHVARMLHSQSPKASRRFRLSGIASRNAKSRPFITQNDLGSIVSSMHKVTSLTIEWPESVKTISHFPLIIPTLAAGFSTFRDCLKSLSLSLPLESLRDLDVASLRLPSLSDLKVDVFQFFATTDPNELMKSVLAPFISAHLSSGISSLTLRGTQEFSLSPLLTALPLSLEAQLDEKKLRNLSIVQSFNTLAQSDTSGISHLLSMHSRSLESFTLRFTISKFTFEYVPGPRQWYSQPLFTNVRFESLKKMDLSLRACSADTDMLIQYLKTLSPTLEELHLRKYRFTYAEVRKVLEVFSTSSKDPRADDIGSSQPRHRPQLRRLGLQTRNLAPCFLDLFALHVPHLESLAVGFMEYLHDSDSARSSTLYVPSYSAIDYDQFRTDMQSRHYPNWELRELTLEPTGPLTENLGDYLQAVIECLPRLRKVNGQEVNY